MAATITNPKKLFLHELGDLLSAERTIAKMLPAMQQGAKDEKLATRLRQHLKETEKHAQNVEQIFKALGEQARAVR
jgi:Mn-containing catalase